MLGTCILHQKRNNVSFSAGHYNPAVSLGAFVAGQLTAFDTLLYVFIQIVGASLGALLLPVRLVRGLIVN